MLDVAKCEGVGIARIRRSKGEEETANNNRSARTESPSEEMTDPVAGGSWYRLKYITIGKPYLMGF